MRDNSPEKTPQTAPWMSFGTPLKMGLRSCDEADWLLDADYFGDAHALMNQRAQKAALCENHHDIIFKSTDDAQAASIELYQMIDDNLRRYHHQRLEINPKLHPLDNAARSLAEDLCLLAPSGEADKQKWILKAASLAFPSHWSLDEKFNKPMGTIHNPVPDYDTHLENAVDRFFNKMMVGPISKRRNWTMQIDDALHTPHRLPTAPLLPQDVGTRLHVRVETQTLRKLPITGWIIFTIRTAITPINRWANDIDALQELCALLSDFRPAMRSYRGVESYEKQLHAWIDECTSKAG